jgi:hypothetical protein
MPEETDGIFISYRRDDSAGYAGRITDSFEEYFGKDNVFGDIDSIEPGLDFSEAIERALESSEVLVAVIGKNWLTATDAAGRKRLQDPHDYVRMEIAVALQRNLRVVPVLVQGAAMPSTDELPDDLAPLSRRNAFEIHDSSWRDDLRHLITALDGVLKRRRPYLRHQGERSTGGTVEREEIPAEQPAHTQSDVISRETIFISYSRKDWDKFVEPLIIDLRRWGFKVWTDQDFIRGGQQWKDSIQEALDTCERMVLCVSPDSLKSRYVRDEYRYFVDEDSKQVFPLICREVRLPWDLKGLQHVSYQDRASLVTPLRRWRS